MVFQAALSGTNYFKRPPLYHNRIKKRKISPISGSPKLSTRELIIEPRAFLSPSSQRHRSIYFGKVVLLLKTHCWLRAQCCYLPLFLSRSLSLSQCFHSSLQHSPWRDVWIGLGHEINMKTPRPASAIVLVKQNYCLCCNGLKMNWAVNLWGLFQTEVAGFFSLQELFVGMLDVRFFLSTAFSLVATSSKHY